MGRSRETAAVETKSSLPLLNVPPAPAHRGRSGRLKFRVKQIVYVAFSLDETELGFAFPKEERAALVAAQPHRFHLPRPSDLRFNWVEAELAALDPAEAREFVVDAWRMVVPKKLSRAYDLTHPDGPG